MGPGERGGGELDTFRHAGRADSASHTVSTTNVLTTNWNLSMSPSAYHSATTTSAAIVYGATDANATLGGIRNMVSPKSAAMEMQAAVARGSCRE